MQIEQNDKLARYVLKQIIEAYKREEKPFDGKWHVYDMLFPRKTYGCKLYGCKPTREDIGFFFLGKAIHAEIQRILGVEKSEVMGEKFGIVGTMDYKGARAYEIKSSRKWTVPKMPEAHYIRQAGYYALIHALTEVEILVIYPTAGRTWKGKKSSTVEVCDWTLTLSPKDKKLIEYDLLRTKEELERAIKKKNPSHLPPAPSWTVERFEGKVSDGGFEKHKREIEKHPFWYTFQEKGAL